MIYPEPRLSTVNHNQGAFVSNLQNMPLPLDGLERGVMCLTALGWFLCGVFWVLIVSRVGRHSGYSARPILMLILAWVWAKSAGELLLGFGYPGAERIATYLQPVGALAMLLLGVWVLAFHRARWATLTTVVREPSYFDLVVAFFTEPFRADPTKPRGRRRDDRTP